MAKMVRTKTVIPLLLLLLLIVVATAVHAESFKKGDQVFLLAKLNMRDAPCGKAIDTTSVSTRATVTAVRKASNCQLGEFTWIGVSVDLPGQGKRTVWVAQETGLVLRDSGEKKVNYKVPMVYQRWDTGDAFNGRSACGPTSAVMALAYFDRLAKRPLHTSSPYPHSNDYGYYVSHAYRSLTTGHWFNNTLPDPSGRPAAGAWGACTDGKLAWAWRIQDYVTKHGLKQEFFPSSDYDSVRLALQRGRLVIQSTNLTAGGHLVLVRGYDDATGRLICNDPWGDQGKPGYGTEMNGENVYYTMDQMKLKWRVEVWDE